MATPLHIGLVTDSDAFAGTERHILDLAHGLRNTGAEAVLICPGDSPLAARAREAAFPVVDMPKRPGFDHAAVRLLRRLLSSRRVDILHAHNGRTALWSAMAKTAVIHGHAMATQHFLEPAHASRSGLSAWASAFAHRWLNRKLDHIVAISGAVRDSALKRDRIPKISVVHNGIADPDPRGLRPAKETRAMLGVGADPLIVCTARLEPEKDIACLIRAIQRLPNPRPMCVIAGDGSERRRLETEIRCRNLVPHVRLAGYQTDVYSLIHAADLFVLPSVAEPFGLALLEAMALRKPVIATNAGGPREIVVDGITGLLVPPGNDEAMALAIQALTASPQTAITYGIQGRLRFEERFTVDRMIETIAPIYSSVSRKPFPA